MSCSLTRSQEAKGWPEGIISVKLTVNPYLYAMAHEESARRGLSLWEFINVALWENLGKPDHHALLEFAASLDLNDEDPKWKKRLKMTARHELDVLRNEKRLQASAEEDSTSSSDSGPGQSGSS